VASKRSIVEHVDPDDLRTNNRGREAGTHDLNFG
jgi:hypothetical protein